MADTQTFDPDARAIPFAEEGVGPVVVLIAARGLTIDYLSPLSHSLATEDFRVVRIGARDDADAAAPTDRAQDVVDLLDHLAIDHAWIGGHRDGGTVARFVALDHHDRVNGVLLLGVEDGDLPAPADGVPVLVIQGTADTVTPVANGEALRAQAPGLVSVVPVEGGGDLFPTTHVGATSWAIEDYLDWD